MWGIVAQFDFCKFRAKAVFLHSGDVSTIENYLISGPVLLDVFYVQGDGGANTAIPSFYSTDNGNTTVPICPEFMSWTKKRMS